MTRSDLLPRRSQPDHDPGPVLVSVPSSGSVFEVLRSHTARSILQVLTEDPKSLSDVAETVDTSVQNATYHVDNLRDAGLVEVVDTWYSPKGTEMDVYASTCDSIVLFNGDGTDESVPDGIETLEA